MATFGFPAGTDPTNSSHLHLDSAQSQDSDIHFWHNVYASNSQDETDSQNQQFRPSGSPSRLDSDWGHVLSKSRKFKVSKKRKLDLGSCSSSAVNSSSDISEALSAISNHLSLSSSGSSSHSSGERNQQEMDASIEDDPIFNINSFSLESDGDDILSLDSDEDEMEADAREETWTNIFKVPELGMEFSSGEEAYKFYKIYATQVGFTVRKGKVQRLSNGALRKRYFFCSKQGFRSKKQCDKMTKYKRKETRTGCDAKIQFTVENGKWVISQFSQEHNHELESHKVVPHSMTRRNNEDQVKDAGVKKNAELSNMYCSTHLHDNKVKSLQPEDAQNLMNCLRRMQVEDPSFFYAVQLDAKGSLTNFFWRDGRSKVDYDYFGDVLILDASFKMDKYDMICAQFLGLNHHQQHVLFGCALLLDESTCSMVWLFETFMEAMRRRQPKTILTDEGLAMVDAIKQVLPEAEHQFGLWFIHQNLSKNLSTYCGQPDFESLFYECVSLCETEDKFHSRWTSLLNQFNLHDNPWLSALYLTREKWAYAFTKKTFHAGINSMFRNPMTKTSPVTLSMLVHQYSEVAEQQRKMELYEDFYCNETAQVAILSGSAIEKQAADVYTHTMFKMFQEELVKCLSLAMEEIKTNQTTVTYSLIEGSQKKIVVEFNCLDSVVTCSCKKYELVGILCAHALKVLNARNIFQIPPRYILKRWTKTAKDGMVADNHGQCDRRVQSLTVLMDKSLNLISKSVGVGEGQKVAEDYLDMALKKVEDILKTKKADDLKTEFNRVSNEHNNDVHVQAPKEVRTDQTQKKLGLSRKQLAFLEKVFKKHNTLKLCQVNALAMKLNLHPDQVEAWFQQKRARVVQIETIKSRLREMERNWIPYSEFDRICREACADPEQAVWVTKTLEKSGMITVLGNVVLLRPEQQQQQQLFQYWNDALNLSPRGRMMMMNRVGPDGQPLFRSPVQRINETTH